MPSDAIRAARALLPLWVVWAPLGSLLLQAACSSALAGLAILLTARPLRRLGSDAPWPERARLVRRVRLALMQACLLSTLAAAPLAVSGPLGLPTPLVYWALAPLPAIGATLAVAFAFEDRHVRRLPWTTRWRSAAGWALLVAPPYLVAVAVGGWAHRSRLSPAAAFAVSGLAVVLAAGAAPWLGRAAGLVRAPPARLRAAMANAARAVGVEARALVLPIAGANAMAFQLTGTVAVTEGALAAFEDAELEAVLAHELGHLREPLAVQLLRALATAAFPVLFVVAPWVLHLELEGWSVVALLGLGLLLLYRRLQRALEQRADAVAAASFPALAAALEKLGSYNLAPAVTRRAGSHPDLYDRMVAAGRTPAWPRPAPPPRQRAALLALLVAALAILAAGWWARDHAREAAPSDRRALVALVALEGDGTSLVRLAFWHVAHGEQGPALVLLSAAEALETQDPALPAWRAYLLADQGRCDEARAAADRATSLAPDSEHARAARQVTATCAGAGADPATSRAAPPPRR